MSLLPKLASNWKTLPLGEGCDLIMGQAPKGATYNDKGIGTALIAGAADLGPNTPKHKKWTNAPTKIGKQGDIIICVRATIGDLNWADKEYCYGRGVAGLRVNCRFDPEFIWFWLTACKDHLLSLGRGATFKQISKTDIASLPVPELGITEQRRIVACIKECMERVEEIENLRAEAMKERDYLLESLVEAEYQEVEGEDVMLADVCTITSKLVDPREKQYFDLLHIGGGNIEAKTSKLLELKTAREEKLKSSKFVFDESMVLYNKIRPYLMKVARPDFPGLCSADMYPLFPDPKRLTRDYLFYLLLSRNFTDYVIAGSNRAGMPKVNRNHLFAYKFTLPSIEKQQRVAEALDVAVSAVEELRGDMTVSASEANTLRESILRKAFAGGL